MTTAPEYYGVLIALPHSINNYMQHTFWGKTETEIERERVVRPATPFDCANVCAALEMCVSCCCIRRFTFLSAIGEGGRKGVSRERPAFFALCRLHLNILHMRQVASNGGWRCKALSTLQSLHSAPPSTYLPSIFPPPATPPVSLLSAYTVPICRQVCFATQAWKTPSKSSVKFWPSYQLINVKEEGKVGKGSGKVREEGGLWVCGVDNLISVYVFRLI